MNDSWHLCYSLFRVGISGSGKSTIAGQLFKDWERRFTTSRHDGVISCDSKDNIHDGVRQLCEYWRFEYAPDNPGLQLRKLIKNFSEKFGRTDKKMLLALDDVSKDFYQDLIGLCSEIRSDRMRVVVTTQCDGMVYRSCKLLSVGGFSDTEATECLNTVLVTDQLKQMIPHIKAALSCLPIAIGNFTKKLKPLSVSYAESALCLTFLFMPLFYSMYPCPHCSLSYLLSWLIYCFPVYLSSSSFVPDDFPCPGKSPNYCG